MTTQKNVAECISLARKDEEKGKKHKGLLIVERNDAKAEEYLKKAKINLELCDLYRERRIDYKIPEEWFYTLYYCALAILAKFGIESRSQRCTALFLRYAKEKGVIDLDEDFIDRMTVHSNKEERSAVDDREASRYGASVHSEEVMQKYGAMQDVCKKCLSQTEDIVFSKKELRIPKELLKQ